MIKSVSLINLFLMLFMQNGNAREIESDFLYDFLVNQYTVIGKYPESNDTYTGSISFSSHNDSLKMTRIIDGKKTMGRAWIAEVLADKIKVLKAEFDSDGRTYEITYLIDSDLDNYARLSGLVYFKFEKTRRPGMEALFIKHELMD